MENHFLSKTEWVRIKHVPLWVVVYDWNKDVWRLREWDFLLTKRNRNRNFRFLSGRLVFQQIGLDLATGLFVDVEDEMLVGRDGAILFPDGFEG